MVEEMSKEENKEITQTEQALQKEEHEEDKQLLAAQNDYLEVGIHIATKIRSPGMRKFIYKVREDGLYLLDIKTIDTKLRIAAAMIARYDPKDVVITSSRIYAIVPAEKFASIIGAKFIKGRVTPGIFTNPNRNDYMESKLIVISDTRNEKQAIKEASKESIPTIAISDTDNSTKFVDLIVPANNRGRRSLAFIYYLLAREVLKTRGDIKSDAEFQFKLEDFEAKSEGAKPSGAGQGGERLQQEIRAIMPTKGERKEPAKKPEKKEEAKAEA